MTAATEIELDPAVTRCAGTTQDLTVAAHLILNNCGIQMAPRRVLRLVQTFKARVEQNGFSFFDFLANSVCLTAEERRTALADPEISRVIAYSDPTGETAIRNVMRGNQ